MFSVCVCKRGTASLDSNPTRPFLNLSAFRRLSPQTVLIEVSSLVIRERVTGNNGKNNSTTIASSIITLLLFAKEQSLCMMHCFLSISPSSGPVYIHIYNEVFSFFPICKLKRKSFLFYKK